MTRLGSWCDSVLLFATQFAFTAQIDLGFPRNWQVLLALARYLHLLLWYISSSTYRVDCQALLCSAFFFLSVFYSMMAMLSWTFVHLSIIASGWCTDTCHFLILNGNQESTCISHYHLNLFAIRIIFVCICSLASSARVIMF